MSVLIKDMVMPETCDDCPFHVYHSHYEYVCKATPMFYPMNLANTKGIRKEWCPLSELPSAQPSSSCAHENDQDLQSTCNNIATDCISRQAAISLPVKPKEDRYFQTQNLDDAYDYGWSDLQRCIEKLPSAQPEIVTCKECVHYFDDFFHCNRVTWDNEKDDFCSKGKRKTDGGRD